MLRSRLIWRMVAPVLVLSLFLLIVGAGAGWYVHVANTDVAASLNRCLTAVIAGEDLVLVIRDVRVEIDRFGMTGDETHLAAAQTLRQRIASALKRIEEELGTDAGELPGEIAAAKRRFFDGLVSDQQSASGEASRWRNQLNQQLLQPSYALLDRCQELAKEDSRRNQVIADRIGIGLFVLGVCGAGAGLLAGHGIARAVSRSLEQLSGSVRAIAGTLDEPLQDARELPAVRDLPDLYSTMQRLAGRTATVVQQLQETRQHAERSGHLAVIGQFAAGLAHELRNPLTSIKLLVQSAGERHAGLAGRDLEVLEEEIGRLENLLQSFIDFARPPHLYPQTCDVRDLTRQTIEFARRRAEQHGVEVAFQIPSQPVPLQADVQKLRQLLLNLLLNAIDAQPDGGAVTVRVAESGDAQQPQLIIEVADQGPGLPPELGEQIFEPFVSTKETGLGLGLSVSRRIVESHGGVLQAENRPEGGAVFRIHLPLGMDRTPTDRIG
jgi:two-component system, NtrC family, sensor histidine kinase HydH